MSHTNKKILGAGAAVVALSAFVPNPFVIGEALAQATASAPISVAASVINPLSLTQVAALNYGGIAVSAASGSYKFNATTASISNGLIITAGVLGKVRFTAPQNATFTVTIAEFAGAGTNEITLATVVGGATSKTMKISKLTLDATAKMTFDPGGVGIPDNTETFKTLKTNESAKINDVGGKATATIGGVLNFKPNQVVGPYTATFTISMTL